jgi:hypothetical protein
LAYSLWAEDTNFSFSARSKGVLLGAIDALAYHQHHPSYDPPLNHLEAIVKNAGTFFHKWNRWPMEGWLRKFVAMGFIDWEADLIRIRRMPGQHEINACLKP